MGLSYCGDTSAAEWITASPLPWERLVTFGPDGFPAHARLRFIPDPERPGQAEGDVDLTEDHPADLTRVRSALARLAGFTDTPRECYFCLWDGHPGVDLPLVARQHPVDLVHRRLALLRGPLADVGDWERATGIGDSAPPPALVWPADRRWVLACDVDPHWAGIGAEPAAIAALVATPGLDVVPADPAERQPGYR